MFISMVRFWKYGLLNTEKPTSISIIAKAADSRFPDVIKSNRVLFQFLSPLVFGPFNFIIFSRYRGYALNNSFQRISLLSFYFITFLFIALFFIIRSTIGMTRIVINVEARGGGLVGREGGEHSYSFRMKGVL